MSFWSAVGTGVGYVGNFVGSTIRNTLVVASNILPDGGLFGSIGDSVGNAFSVGKPFASGSGSAGGSVLDLFKPDSSWDPVAGLDFSSAFDLAPSASPGASGAEPAKPVELSGTKRVEPGAGAKKSAAEVAAEDPSALPTSMDLVGMPKPDDLYRFDAFDVGSAEREAAVTKAANDLQKLGMAGLPESATDRSAAVYRESLPLLETELVTWREAKANGDSAAANAAVSRIEAVISQLQRASGGVDKDTQLTIATFNQAVKKVNQSDLAGAAPLTGDKVKNLPAARRYNRQLAAVKSAYEDLSERIQIATEDGGAIPIELSLEVQEFNQQVDGLLKTRSDLAGMTYRDGWRRFNVLTNEDMGVDLDNLAMWAQLLTPVALVGLQYYAQGRADDKNAKYLAKEKEKDRQFEREMQENRLQADMAIAGMNADAAGASPGAVGASRTHSFSAGTSAS